MQALLPIIHQVDPRSSIAMKSHTYFLSLFLLHLITITMLFNSKTSQRPLNMSLRRHDRCTYLQVGVPWFPLFRILVMNAILCMSNPLGPSSKSLFCIQFFSVIGQLLGMNNSSSSRILYNRELPCRRDSIGDRVNNLTDMNGLSENLYCVISV